MPAFLQSSLIVIGEFMCERMYVITLTDCCASLSQEVYSNALEKDFSMFSQPMDHLTFIKVLEHKEEFVLAGKGYE